MSDVPTNDHIKFANFVAKYQPKTPIPDEVKEALENQVLKELNIIEKDKK